MECRKGTFAEIAIRRMTNRQRKNHANKLNIQGRENLQVHEETVRSKESNGSLYCDGARGKTQRHPSRSAEKAVEEVACFITILMLVCSAIIVGSSGCAIEAIAILRTEEAVTGKLAIVRDAPYVPPAPEDPSKPSSDDSWIDKLTSLFD